MSFIAARNTNKIVTIKRNLEGKTWRNSLSTIINNYADARGYIFGDYSKSLLGELDVDPRIELLMNDDLKQMKFSAKYETPVANAIDKFMEIPVGNFDLGFLTQAAANAISGIRNISKGSTEEMTSSGVDPWIKNIPAYSTGSAQPLDVSYTFNFRLGQYGLWNAEKEVLLPALNLIAPIIPQHLGSFTVNGPAPSAVNLLTNVIADLFDKDKRQEVLKNYSDNTSGFIDFSSFSGFLSSGAQMVSAALEAVLLSAYQSFTYDVSFGNILSLKNVILNNGTVQFSADTDQNGYPISATIDLTFQSIVPTSVVSSTTNNLGVRFGKRGV